jgi:hypothetical protein
MVAGWLNEADQQHCKNYRAYKEDGEQVWQGRTLVSSSSLPRAKHTTTFAPDRV